MLELHTPDDSTGRLRLPRSGTVWSLWQLMKFFPLKPTFALGRLMEDVSREYYLDESYTTPERTEFSADFKHTLKAVLFNMAGWCEQLDSEEMASFIKSHATDDDELPPHAQAFDTLCKGFWAAMEKKSVFFMDRYEADFYRTSRDAFGSEVARAFKGVSGEIEQASKCLAFGLSTACVFHLMLAMEKAVRQMATHLGATFPDNTDWGSVLSAMDKKIDEIPKGPKQTQWSEARKNLWHVKQAVRKEVMHPSRAPYTQAEAEANFEAVKTFMVHMAKLVLPPPPVVDTTSTLTEKSKPRLPAKQKPDA